MYHGHQSFLEPFLTYISRCYCGSTEIQALGPIPTAHVYLDRGTAEPYWSELSYGAGPTNRPAT
jgi:hypothetical protein